VNVRAAQAPVLAVVSGARTEAKASQFAALVVADQTKTAAGANVSQAPALAVVSLASDPLSFVRVSQAPVLVVYGTGPREDYSLRAWGFEWDGHIFYALTLGQTGTYVLDLATGQWSKWVTQGLPTWNMEIGWTWELDRIVAADNQNPVVWEMDFINRLDDEFKPIVHTATAITPARGHTTVVAYIMNIVGEMGNPQASPANFRLRWSDDQGRNWSDWLVFEVADGDVMGQIEFRGLGCFGAPGRVWEFEDTGAMVRLNDADLESA